MDVPDITLHTTSHKLLLPVAGTRPRAAQHKAEGKAKSGQGKAKGTRNYESKQRQKQQEVSSSFAG